MELKSPDLQPIREGSSSLPHPWMLPGFIHKKQTEYSQHQELLNSCISRTSEANSASIAMLQGPRSALHPTRLRKRNPETSAKRDQASSR
ncbi:hypothetical protein Nepgr_023909 [Nepenthes gracilis]|uniref:Uncharacterized protein n=1 Tax=Nepenthes gracilis TaxID=150966 RepID=A0AAD3XZY0_NEPGR|nr:hypothetical protein Nepgr_023909 [Nepenthes gracilis]